MKIYHNFEWRNLPSSVKVKLLQIGQRLVIVMLKLMLKFGH